MTIKCFRDFCVLAKIWTFFRGFCFYMTIKTFGFFCCLCHVAAFPITDFAAPLDLTNINLQQLKLLSTFVFMKLIFIRRPFVVRCQKITQVQQQKYNQHITYLKRIAQFSMWITVICTFLYDCMHLFLTSTFFSHEMKCSIFNRLWQWD